MSQPKVCPECQAHVDRHAESCTRCGARRPAEDWPVDSLRDAVLDDRYRVDRRRPGGDSSWSTSSSCRAATTSASWSIPGSASRSASP